jgi:hypothetical protein
MLRLEVTPGRVDGHHSVPSHRTWPDSTSLTCGGPVRLRRRPATRLIEVGPRRRSAASSRWVDRLPQGLPPRWPSPGPSGPTPARHLTPEVPLRANGLNSALPTSSYCSHPGRTLQPGRAPLAPATRSCPGRAVRRPAVARRRRRPGPQRCPAGDCPPRPTWPAGRPPTPRSGDRPVAPTRCGGADLERRVAWFLHLLDAMTLGVSAEPWTSVLQRWTEPAERQYHDARPTQPPPAWQPPW